MLRESSSSLLAYGLAARRTTTPGIGDLLPTIRQPQPALFRIAHPGGLDFTFGHGGAATMTMQEFGPAAAVAAIHLAVSFLASSAPQEAMSAYGRLLARLTDAQRFPALHAAIASGAFDEPDDPDGEFVFGLERILDGIDALVRARN